MAPPEVETLGLIRALHSGGIAVLEREPNRAAIDLRADIEARDARDQSRVTAPLKPAQDALLLDNSDLSVQACVDIVLDWWKDRQPPRTP